MKRLRTLILPLAVLLASGVGWAAPAADQLDNAGPAAVSGNYTVSFNVSLGSTVPAGATITCRAKVAPNGTFFGSLGRGAVPVGTGVARVTGNTANCSVEIPFSWTVNDPRNGAALSYEIEAVNGSGPLPGAVRTLTQQNIGVAYPPGGGAARLSFNVAF